MSEAHQDFDTQLRCLLLDIEDLEASVLAVEESGDRWGISHYEVKARRRFLESVRGEVKVRHSAAQPSPRLFVETYFLRHVSLYKEMR